MDRVSIIIVSILFGILVLGAPVQAQEDLAKQSQNPVGNMISLPFENSTYWLYAQNLEAVEFFKEQGVETVTMDPETVETFAKWAREWIEEQAAQDEFFAKV